MEKEQWKDFFAKHTSALLFALGMLFFLLAGLLVYSVPSFRNILPKETASLQSSPPLLASSAQGEDAVNEGSNRFIVRRSAGSASGVSVQTFSESLPVSNDTEGVQWYLYITGSVRNPGVYRLPPGARLFQLVDAAGGFNNFADTVAVNMAASLEDGMHVHVPRQGENRPPAEPALRPIIEATLGTPEVVVRRTTASSTVSSRQLVDINNAGERELTSLRGVGASLARQIIADRERNGRFGSVDDLLRVKGIGFRLLEGFRDSVIVGP